MSHRFRSLRRLALVLGLLLVAAAALVAPDLAKMDHGRLLSRAGWQLPDRVLASLAVQPGERVADIGAGDGYFTFRLAEAVGPSGKVYAVEVDDERIAELERRVREGGYHNVVVIRGEYHDPLLPDGEVDLVFLCNTYHHIQQRPEYFRRLHHDLAPDARVAVIDMKAIPLVRLLVPPQHWTTLEAMQREMEQASYALAERHDYLPAQNFAVFRPTALH